MSVAASAILDAIKKSAIYEKELNVTEVFTQLDKLNYATKLLRSALMITREQTITANIEKLGKRYSSGSYTNEDAQIRADKV